MVGRDIGETGAAGRNSSDGELMDNKNDPKPPAQPMPTDDEIAAAAEKLSASWADSATKTTRDGSSHIKQSLARGRSRVVAVEIRRPTRGK